jgi:L-glutamine-phosphate cytidylyltransferase
VNRVRLSLSLGAIAAGKQAQVRVIILAAGQGKRLLPLTADVPKALLDIHGQTLLERQVSAFVSAGLKDFVVVTGYGAEAMERASAAIAQKHRVDVVCRYNPFYAVADNLASCWIARDLMDRDFIQVNGDNLFRASLVQRLVASPIHNAALAINTKSEFDADDMKVMLDQGRLTEIGKTLPLDTVDAEAIGFYVFRNAGVTAYVQEIESGMRDPQGLKRWFPSAVGTLAKRIPVGTIDMTGQDWCEVDFPQDLQRARQFVAGWE